MYTHGYMRENGRIYSASIWIIVYPKEVGFGFELRIDRKNWVVLVSFGSRLNCSLIVVNETAQPLCYID